jgi:hypothetical protein
LLVFGFFAIEASPSTWVAGVVSTVAGAISAGNADGTGTAARFGAISALAADRSGNVYIADEGNHAIRLLKPGFVVSTLLGSRGLPNTTLGAAPSVRAPAGIAVLPSNAIAILTEAAVIVD